MKAWPVLFALTRDANVTSLLAAVVAFAIFLADALASTDISAAVLYAAVVLLIARSGNRTSMIAAAWGCVALTLLGFLVSHGEIYSVGAIARCAVSLLALGTISILALRTQAATTALQERSELLNLIHDAIVVHDMSDRIIFWNRGAQALYGWTAKQALGQSLQKMTQTSFAVPYETVRAELLRAEQWHGELKSTRRDGVRLVVSSRAALWRDAKGNPRAVLVASNDITGPKQAQEALARAHGELAHATRIAMLGELAASIAHEVTQPIAAIVTCGGAALRWLNRPTPKLDEAVPSIEQMIRDAKRADEVIQRIRALANKRERVPAIVDLNALIEESVQLMRHELERHRVDLRLNLATAPISVFCDRLQLQQVLINLIINGVQAMAEQSGAHKLHIATCQLKDGHVQVIVQDSGIGIHAEHAGRLFNTFFTTKSDGLGMGLSICRSIVEAHGGRIWAESSADGGASLKFILPNYDGKYDEH